MDIPDFPPNVHVDIDNRTVTVAGQSYQLVPRGSDGYTFKHPLTGATHGFSLALRADRWIVIPDTNEDRLYVGRGWADYCKLHGVDPRPM